MGGSQRVEEWCSQSWAGGASPCFPKTKEGAKGIKEKQSSSDGGEMGIMCSRCFLLYSNEIAKVFERLMRKVLINGDD